MQMVLTSMASMRRPVGAPQSLWHPITGWDSLKCIMVRLEWRVPKLEESEAGQRGKMAGCYLSAVRASKQQITIRST